MKTLTIESTIYNLALLISVKYKPKTKATARRGTKSEDVESPETLKSASSLELRFLDCDTIHLKKDKADAVWSKLSLLLDLDEEQNLPPGGRVALTLTAKPAMGDGWRARPAGCDSLVVEKIFQRVGRRFHDDGP